MSRVFLWVALLTAAACAAFAAEAPAERDVKLAGDAIIYGGDIGDPVGPSPTDAKVLLNITGKVAQRIYELLGPANQVRRGDCDDPGVVSRTRGDIMCMREKGTTYYCYVGIDVTRGKSTAASVC